MIKAVIFDLDDTLYNEADYVSSGFRMVAREISSQTGNAVEEVLAFMLEELATHGRGRVFDMTLAHYNLTVTADRVAELVIGYRSYKRKLCLYPDADRVLSALRGRYRLAVVTDGLPAMQRAKLDALGLVPRVDVAVCCWEYEAPKPDLMGYQIALNQLGVGKDEVIIVGDRPDHDVAAALKLGCVCARVLRGRYANVDTEKYRADYEVTSLDDFLGILERI